MTQTHYTRISSLKLRQVIPPVFPGIALCALITGVAYSLEFLEIALMGKAWLEALVLAILLGTAVRTFWTPSQTWHLGIAFSAKYLLEIAVVLLGASVSTTMIATAGADLLIGIGCVVILAIFVSFGIGKLLRLPTRMALLIACGNSICGNSAIAAVAPVIGADGDDVAASIAFTAVLGVLVVLGLPIFGVAIGLSDTAYGALTGLTVYAVPQVIAAAAPMGVVAIHMGTLVKLVRVLMLGPVCLVLSLLAPYLAPVIAPKDGVIAGDQDPPIRLSIFTLIPWFIIGFLALLACRSLGFIPESIVVPIGKLATLLTVISMAALGLGVDMRVVAQAGGRVTAAVVLSLAALGIISLGLLWALAMT